MRRENGHEGRQTASPIDEKPKKQGRRGEWNVSEASGGKDDGGEFLVILDPQSAAKAQERLRSSHRITQVGSPRVVVVAVSPEETPPSPSTPGVVAVSSGAPPYGVMEELDDQEAMFVRAWASRMTGPQKQRPGEGLPWDAPGFEPPDSPAGEPPPGG